MNYIHPDYVHNIGQNQNIEYNQLIHILQNSPFFNQEYFINNDDENNHNYPIQFHYKQFYVRYLLRLGHVQDATQQLLDMMVYINNYDYTLEEFLNYQHPSFNGESILYFALMWNASLEFVQWIINAGAYINMENIYGQLPGDDVQDTVWYDPFAIYLNTPHIITVNGHPGVRSREHFQALDWFLRHVGETL